MSTPAHEIVAALERLRVIPDQVFELRVPKLPGRGKGYTAAGWFDDYAKLATAALDMERRGAPGIYVTLNPCNPALLGRANNRLIEYIESTTADKDIIRRAWLPIDCDPVRLAGISSDNAELEAARLRIIEVERWLSQELGTEPGIRAFSGNGWHMLYRVDLPNDDQSTAFIKRVIDAAAQKFNSGTVHIDETVFNAGRIWKLYGTLARKGDQVQRLGRVHRRARILQGGFDASNN